MKISLSELADITGLDRRRVTRAVIDLEAESGKKGAKLYNSEEALRLVYTGDNLDANKERTRLTHHQANIAELDEMIKRHELVPFSEAVSEVSEAIANTRAKLLNLPPKLATLLAGIDDVYEAQATLEGAILEALAELHNEYADYEGGGEGVEAAA